MASARRGRSRPHAAYRFEARAGSAAATRRGALDVAQEGVAEAAVAVRALDEARDVGHLDALAVEAEVQRAQVRAERGERVRRHLG